MATIRIFLDKRRTKTDGTNPLKIRITHQRKSWELPIDSYITADTWDKSKGQIKNTHPNHRLINLKIRKRLSFVEEQILELERKDADYSLEDVKGLFAPKEKEEEEKMIDAIMFGQMLVEEMKAVGRLGNADAYNTALNQLKSFTPSPTFEEINYNFLTKWEMTLKQKGTKINTISVYFRTVRAVFNQAIKRDVVDQKHYPFNKFKIKSERTVQRTLTKEQIKEIEALELKTGTGMDRARDTFILSFNLCGMNFRDIALLTEDNIQADRIIYRRQKTHKIYSIKITPKAKEIIEKYKGENSPFVMPIVPNKHKGDKDKQQKSAKEMVKNYNTRYYHEIGKLIGLPKITTYYARYSWANIARKLGYSKDLIAEALGHEYGNRVTGIYLDNYDLEVIDEMNEKVCR